MAFLKKTEKKETPKYTWQQNLSLYLHDLVYMLTVVMIVLMLVFRIIIVDGPSMQNTLQDGDYMLLISNLFYKDFQYGDVVVVSKHTYDDGKPIVKRVIATEGQTVDIDFESGTVYVDGQALREPYIHNETTNEEGTVFPLTVAENCIFVLGDNRAVSLDSRSPQIGQIDRREVLGKALCLIIPGTHHGQLLPDYSRIGAVN